MRDKVDCDRVRLRIFNYINHDLKRHITQSERNNDILKMVVDTYTETIVLLMETDDLIIEYSLEDERIVNFIVKDNSQDDSPYQRMRERHLKNWQDETEYIQTHYKEGMELMVSLLPHLKQLIDYFRYHSE